MLTVLIEELLIQCLDGEGVFDVLNLYSTSLVDESLEVVRGRTTVLSRAEEEGEALATRGVCLTSPLVAEGEAPLPGLLALRPSILVVEEHEGQGMSIHDPTYQLLDAHPITSHMYLTSYRDVKYL